MTETKRPAGRKGRKFLMVTLLVILLTAIVAVATLFFLRNSDLETAVLLFPLVRLSTPWEEESIDLPENFGTIWIGTKPAHPFLNESDYRLRFTSQRGREITRELFPDTGGYPGVSVFWYPKIDKYGPFARIQRVVHPPGSDGPEIWSDVLIDAPAATVIEPRQTVSVRGEAPDVSNSEIWDAIDRSESRRQVYSGGKWTEPGDSMD